MLLYILSKKWLHRNLAAAGIVAGLGRLDVGNRGFLLIPIEP